MGWCVVYANWVVWIFMTCFIRCGPLILFLFPFFRIAIKGTSCGSIPFLCRVLVWFSSWFIRQWFVTLARFRALDFELVLELELELPSLFMVMDFFTGADLLLVFRLISFLFYCADCLVLVSSPWYSYFVWFVWHVNLFF